MYTANYHSPKYLITPQTILTSQKYGDPKNADWLNNAIELKASWRYGKTSVYQFME